MTDKEFEDEEFGDRELEDESQHEEDFTLPAHKRPDGFISPFGIPSTIVIGINVDDGHFISWDSICCTECYDGPFTYGYSNQLVNPRVSIFNSTGTWQVWDRTKSLSPG